MSTPQDDTAAKVIARILALVICSAFAAELLCLIFAALHNYWGLAVPLPGYFASWAVTSNVFVLLWAVRVSQVEL